MQLVFSSFSIVFLGMSPWFCLLWMKASELIAYHIDLDFIKSYYCFNVEFQMLEYIIVTYFL
jgi:hypothetical protein